jgi:hypothetical protein
VLLDVSSITPDRILLLDTYFNVVVFHGVSCCLVGFRMQGLPPPLG